MRTASLFPESSAMSDPVRETGAALAPAVLNPTDGMHSAGIPFGPVADVGPLARKGQRRRVAPVPKAEIGQNPTHSIQADVPRERAAHVRPALVPSPGTQCARLLALLQDGNWHSNFQLAEDLYGPRPCGRLGARIYDLQRMGYDIDHARDAEVFFGEQNRARYWYRLVVT